MAVTPQTEHAADSGLAGEPLRLHVHKTRGAKLVATGLFEQGFCVCNRFSPKRTWGEQNVCEQKKLKLQSWNCNTALYSLI